MSSASNVAVAGVGHAGFAATTPELSWKELMYKAATRAYRDAGVDPRRDVDSFLTCAEDYWEGFSIFDEFVPDQLGSVLRPTGTVTDDGIVGLGNAAMQIRTGEFDVVAVEAHSKASDLLTHEDVQLFGMDPLYERPITGPPERGDRGEQWVPLSETDPPSGGPERVHPSFVAGLEMREYLDATETGERAAAEVVTKNKRNALDNPLATYEASVSPDEVLASDRVADPLRSLEMSRTTDGAITFVLMSGDVVDDYVDDYVWLEGFGWGSGTPWLSSRDTGAGYTRQAAEMAYDMAGLTEPRAEVDFAEVDDRYSFKELQHLEALGMAPAGRAGEWLRDGTFASTGSLPVNVSGGSLGVGALDEATGLQRSLEAVLQLRGDAGSRQLDDVSLGLAHSWRGVPTASGAVAIFGGA